MKRRVLASLLAIGVSRDDIAEKRDGGHIPANPTKCPLSHLTICQEISHERRRGQDWVHCAVQRPRQP